MVSPSPFTSPKYDAELLYSHFLIGLKLNKPIQAVPIVAIHIGQIKGLFRSIIESPNGTSAADLAEKSNPDLSITDMLLDYMATQFMIDEVSPGHYKATKLTYLLSKHEIEDGDAQ